MSGYQARRDARMAERYGRPRYASSQRPAGSEPRTPRPGPSVYAKRFERKAVPADWPTYRANVMGHVVELPACCLDPSECTRDECWTPLREIG